MNSKSSKSSIRPAPASTPDRAELDLLRQKIGDLSLKHPQKAALILSQWLDKAAKKQTIKKAG